MPDLALIRLSPDLDRLALWATQHGYAPGGCDAGYALHAALKEALGDLAPRPFVLRSAERTNTKPRPPELLGYVGTSPDILRQAAALPPLPERAPAAALLQLDRLDARAMPAGFASGQRFDFELRVRPVVRTRATAIAGAGADRARQRRRGMVEVDAWLHRRHAEPEVTAETAYADWLRERLAHAGAAQLLAATVTGRRATRVLRQTQGDERHRRMVTGPDVWLRGSLAIGAPEAFRALLTHGVGRHAAFGFGCLLLAPAGTLVGR